MSMIEAFGLKTEDAKRIQQDIKNIADSSKTLEEAIHAMCEKYDAESLIAGGMFLAGAFTSRREIVYGAPGRN